jgi:hypothetical protein
VKRKKLNVFVAISRLFGRIALYAISIFGLSGVGRLSMPRGVDTSATKCTYVEIAHGRGQTRTIYTMNLSIVMFHIFARWLFEPVGGDHGEQDNLRLRSSAEEHFICNEAVGGANPPEGSLIFVV